MNGTFVFRHECFKRVVADALTGSLGRSGSRCLAVGGPCSLLGQSGLLAGVILFERRGGLHYVGQLGSGDVVVAGMVGANEALKVRVEAAEKRKDDAGLGVGLAASETALCQGTDPAGEGQGGFILVLVDIQ